MKNEVNVVLKMKNYVNLLPSKSCQWLYPFSHSKQVLKLKKVVSQAHLWVSIENVGYFENDILNHKSHGVCSDRF